MHFEDLVKQPYSQDWSNNSKECYENMFGSEIGIFGERARKAVALRAPDIDINKGVPFTALIHESNPDSGPYGGMSFVIFPIENGPALISMVVGTQGLSPDEDILSRPGHGRKVSALCSWLNSKYGNGKAVAWSKQDPVRMDIDIPKNVLDQFPRYASVFKRYGKVIYGFFAPPEEENEQSVKDTINTFLALYFDEYGHKPLSKPGKEIAKLEEQYLSYLMPNITDEDLMHLLLDRHFAVLTGPPGTGKTYMALQLLKNQFHGRGKTIQFHPNTTYETFVGGLFPEKNTSSLGFSFSPKPGVLMEAVAEAHKTEDPFLLIIDEINRADLSKVLGEAIFLFEKNDFSRKLDLPHDFGTVHGKTLSIPQNLFILGTMNSADRSIAILDIAIRRRFAFAKLWPQYSVVEKYGSSLMKGAYEKLVNIFVEYASEEVFALMPGHSYFMEEDNAKAVQSLKTNLVPLLEEYLEQGYVSSFSGPVDAYIQWIKTL